MLENKSIIVDLMEGLVQMPANNANLLLDALIPLTKVSPTIRDHFILILRKALYSRLVFLFSVYFFFIKTTSELPKQDKWLLMVLSS